MPIVSRIDHPRRLVLAAGRGAFTDKDVFGYQMDVWSRPEVAGYDELMDMTDVTEIEPPPVDRVIDLAALASQMASSNSSSRFAIIAPSDLAYGLGRMFQGWRGCEDGGRRRVEVFRTRTEALEFLGLDTMPELNEEAPPRSQ